MAKTKKPTRRTASKKKGAAVAAKAKSPAPAKQRAAGAPPAMPATVVALPGWVEDAVVGAAAGWKLLGEAESEAETERARRGVDLRALDVELKDSCVARVGRSRVVANGPRQRLRTRSDIGCSGLLWLDPEHPEQLWLDLGLTPLFWAPAGMEPAALAKVTGFYYRRQARTAAELDGHLRGWVAHADTILPGQCGILGDDEVCDALAEQLILDDALEEGLSWGSASSVDPYPDPFPPGAEIITGADEVMLAGMRQRAMEQDPSRPSSVSIRTRWSRSVVRFESHFGQMIVVDVSYPRAIHEATFGILDPRQALRFPGDLPVDVAEALRNRAVTSRETLRAALDAKQPRRGWSTAGLFGAYAAVRDDAEFVAELSTWATHPDPDVRWFVALIALRRRSRGLLELVAIRETRSSHRSALERAIANLG